MHLSGIEASFLDGDTVLLWIWKTTLSQLFPHIELLAFWEGFYRSLVLSTESVCCLNERSECFNGSCLKESVKRWMYKQDLLKDLSNFCNKRFGITLTKPAGNIPLFSLIPFSPLCLDLYVKARHDDLGLIWHLSSQLKSQIHHNRHCHKWVLRSFHKWRQMMYWKKAWITYIKNPISHNFAITPV